ncbi:hypothetical protein [Vibrio owensii]|uniref:hypothetical protein n=1 Tax=Vibrio owensii TaxID=696485 RepID=UPI0018F231FB|nr:hypothetical protein [Vibrio owensii]
MSNTELVKSIFATMGSMVADANKIKECIKSHAETGRTQDLAQMELISSELVGLFERISEKAGENELRMSRLGIEGNSQYQKLVAMLPDGPTRQAFSDKVQELELSINQAREMMLERETVMASQLAILKGVVGEMQLEINV